MSYEVIGPNNDSSPESISGYLEVVRNGLQDLGVDDLTTAEGVRLRKYLEAILQENKSLESGDAYSYTAIGEPADEAIERFLFDYGINVHTLPVKGATSYYRDPQAMEYIRRKLREQREAQHQPYLD